jgi:hypothetical protein
VRRSSSPERSFSAIVLVSATALVGCNKLEQGEADMAAPAEAMQAMADDKPAEFGGGGAPGAPARSAGKKMRKGKPSAKADRAVAAPQAEPVAVAAEAPADDATPEPEAPTVRSWFPETLLFEPSVVTDASGKAEVPVIVPDRLTTWRVLALAHSRQGAQAGALASFDSRMDAYVDAVAPGFLVVGDEALVPVQVVNTTDEALKTALTLSALGVKVDGRPQNITVPRRLRGSTRSSARLSSSPPVDPRRRRARARWPRHAPSTSRSLISRSPRASRRG